MDGIKSLSLEDLGWTLLETRQETGVTVLHGELSGGLFKGYDPDGNPVQTELREEAAVYIPDGYPETDNPSLGFVYAAHYPSNIFTETALTMARYFGMPVLYHGELPNWRDLGYPNRREINQASSGHILRENGCYPTDFITGNFSAALANTDLRAITLLQRLADEHGGNVEKVALRGFSKEGAAAWKAFLVDDRIEVGAPGGMQHEDGLSASMFATDTYGCQGESEWTDGIRSKLDGRHWALHTPAGAYSLNHGLMQHKDLLFPRFFVIDGDVGMHNMHDGANGMPAGIETGFLDGFVERPWRYVRKGRVQPGSSGEDGDETSKSNVPLLAAENLTEGPGSEDRLFPNVLNASAEIVNGGLRATATLTENTESARVWWTWSEDRIFDDVGQEVWSAVQMNKEGDTWKSPSISIPPDTVVAWYVEASNALRVSGKDYPRNHAAPIRFLRLPDPVGCEYEAAVVCEGEP